MLVVHRIDLTHTVVWTQKLDFVQIYVAGLGVNSKVPGFKSNLCMGFGQEPRLVGFYDNSYVTDLAST